MCVPYYFGAIKLINDRQLFQKHNKTLYRSKTSCLKKMVITVNNVRYWNSIRWIIIIIIYYYCYDNKINIISNSSLTNMYKGFLKYIIISWNYEKNLVTLSSFPVQVVIEIFIIFIINVNNKPVFYDKLVDKVSKYFMNQVFQKRNDSKKHPSMP